MFFKLLYKNTKRSIHSYLIYIATITVFVMVLHITNLISVLAKVEVHAEGSALQVLIVLILAIMLSYNNQYMVKLRSREFALYQLLGLRSYQISLLYFLEALCISTVCFLSAVLFSSILFCFLQPFLLPHILLDFALLVTALWMSFCFFFLLEIAILCHTLWMFHRMRIQELLQEEKTNEQASLHTLHRWRQVFLLSLACCVGCVILLTSKQELLVQLALSTCSIPIGLCLVSLYKAAYLSLYQVRSHHPSWLYTRHRLYVVSCLLTKIHTTTRLHILLSICLLCSFASYLCATLLSVYPKLIFADAQNQWMIFLQYAISFVFLILFFSILMSMHTMELRTYQKGIQLMRRIGIDRKEEAHMMQKEIHAQFFLPCIAAFLVALIGVYCSYHILSFLPHIGSLLVQAAGIYSTLFLLCFFLCSAITKKMMLQTCPVGNT